MACDREELGRRGTKMLHGVEFGGDVGRVGAWGSVWQGVGAEVGVALAVQKDNVAGCGARKWHGGSLLASALVYSVRSVWR